jgi:hypothetical protein
MAETYRTALLILPKQSGLQPNVEPTGFQPVVAQFRIAMVFILKLVSLL